MTSLVVFMPKNIISGPQGETQYCCSLPFDLIVLIFLVFSQFWLESDVTLNWHTF